MISTNTNSDVGPRPTTPVSPNPRAAGTSRSPNATPSEATERLAVGQFDAYQHDSTLMAKWWNLHQSDLSSSPQQADRDSLANGATVNAAPIPSAESSIGAWSDEKPKIQHDGVRIDRIASNGPAEQVGLQIGDYILALGGVYLFTVEELTNNIHRYKPGAQVSLRYRSRSTIYDTFVVMGHVTLTAGTAGKAAN
jgi:hypothetical protein